MNNINILVFPCGSEIGIELFRSLKDIRFVTLFGASSVDDHGKFIYEKYTGNIPYVNDKGFIEAINRVIDENNIDFVFPAMDSVILEMSIHRNELHAGLLTSPDEAVDICRSKAKTYKKLEGCYFLPGTYNSADEVKDFPVLVKPAVSQGAQGVEIVKTPEKLHALLSERKEEQVICEYLPGEEYTVDCFTDRKGVLRFASPRVRGRIRNGISVNSYTVPHNEEILRIAEEINKRIIFRGVWFFQVKRSSGGDLRLLECATRIAGTMCVERARGINLALLTVMDAMDMDVEIIPQVESVTVDRALYNTFKVDVDYDHVYIDFDDTVTVHGKINTTAISFIYQCLAKEIPVTLVTRHDGDIHADLKGFHVDETVFDKIIEVEPGKKKSLYIPKVDKAIYIDDSFAERVDVFKTLGIPSFGTESIEALLDSRA